MIDHQSTVVRVKAGTHEQGLQLLSAVGSNMMKAKVVMLIAEQKQGWHLG